MSKEKELFYIALNKPKGYVCAKKDNLHKTIMELIHEDIKGLHIVGRLDKDTTGLIILTNDGEYTHKATHPKKHVLKRYRVQLEKPIESNYKNIIESGMEIDHGKTKLLPGKFEKIDNNNCFITITQGKFHQVKKMFAALNNKVIELHRDRFDDIFLDELNISLGKYTFIKK